MPMTPTERILQFFTYDHLDGEMRQISEQCCNLANHLATYLPMNAETTTGLRKLLEAKDCFVRSILDKSND